MTTRRSLPALGAAAFLGGCVATVSTTSSGPAPATYRAFNTMLVVTDPTRPATMAVRSQARAGGRDFWCAAGDYAHRFLGVRATDRIYVLGPAVFTTQPPEEFGEGIRSGDGGDYSLHIDKPGFHIQAAQARSFCVESRRRLTGIGFF